MTHARQALPAGAAPLSLRGMAAYGLFGLPLAMVAVPIYIYVPSFYAQRSGLALPAIGAVLLAARMAAACIDPLLGWWILRGGAAYARFVLLSLPLLLAGYAALFHPPALAGGWTVAWFLASLLLVYAGFGLAMIAHQSWGAALTQQPGERARVAAVREGCGLLGVMLAAALPGMAGYDMLTPAFALALLGAAGVLLWMAPQAPQAAAAPARPPAQAAAAPCAMLAPWRDRRFRALFLVLAVNGLAAAIPATLFLFFVDDRLRLASSAGLYLLLYFASAAVSVAGWAGLARRWGEARAWTGGMLLSALVFIWAYALGEGDALAFGLICALSGLALGADLALPPALLAGVIARAGASGRGEAAYFGVWNWGVQMTLALAAGVALPLLAWLGYVPGGGQGDGQAGGHGVAALSFAYAALPCALKLMAAAILWRAPLHDC